MMTVRAFAPAKINLTLHVTGQRADGYHLLDSLVVFADIGDQILVRPADRLQVCVTGPMAAGVPVDDSNLVLRAARLAGVDDAAIEIEKHLPVAAGIGGGSSDAAAVLRALAESHQAAMPDVLALGADVPVCLAGCTARMSGIGEQIDPVSDVPPLPVVLINPGFSVHTPDVFDALTKRNGAKMPEIPAFSGVIACGDWLRDQRNDLQAAAIKTQPVILQVLEALAGNGALLARMSGSGATCFGVFETQETAQDVAKALALSHPDWWVRATVLANT